MFITKTWTLFVLLWYLIRKKAQEETKIAYLPENKNAKNLF